MPHTSIDSPPTEAGGDALAAHVAGLVAELTGRVPLAARSTVGPEHVVVSLAGGVAAHRGQLGAALRARASEAVEELTGDTVVYSADHSNIDCDAIIIFFQLAQTGAARSRTPSLSQGVRDVAVPSGHGRRSPTGTTAARLERAG